MKSLKIILICILCVIFASCTSVNQGNTSFLYNKHDHALLIKNGDSALHFTKIVLNLHKDTLVVDVHKKLGIMESSSVLNWATTSWKINLQPNIGFVRFGKTLTPLSELKTYPVEGPGPYPKSPIIEVFPHTYPCEYK